MFIIDIFFVYVVIVNNFLLMINGMLIVWCLGILMRIGGWLRYCDRDRV